MRVVGGEPSPLRRLVPWLTALVIMGVVFGVTIWARQQDAARRVAESRVEVAEARAVAAEASLTVIARTSQAATATAVRDSNEPEAALRRALDLVFEAYKDPTDAKLRALSDAFSPEALSFERTEAEHLISGGMHLSGGTPYQLDVLSTASSPTGDSQISTHEVWTYDEVDADNRRTRCVREESEQTYDLRRVAASWLIANITLTGSTRRTDC
jgi:hypothetical protein